MLSMPRAGVLCTPHRRPHKKHVPLPAPPPLRRLSFSQSMMILRRSIWSAGAWYPYSCEVPFCACQFHCAPRKRAKARIRLESMHPENWAEIAHTVFSPAARNRAQTDRKDRDANLSPEDITEIRRNSKNKTYNFSSLFQRFRITTIHAYLV